MYVFPCVTQYGLFLWFVGLTAPKRIVGPPECHIDADSNKRLSEEQPRYNVSALVAQLVNGPALCPLLKEADGKLRSACKSPNSLFRIHVVCFKAQLLSVF